MFHIKNTLIALFDAKKLVPQNIRFLEPDVIFLGLPVQNYMKVWKISYGFSLLISIIRAVLKNLHKFGFSILFYVTK